MSAQKREKIIYENEEMFISSIIDMPLKEGIVKEISDKDNELVFSTSCYRRYIGSWKIENGKLYLLDVVGKYKLLKEPPIFADWFSGEIRVTSGEMTSFKHHGFASKFKTERFITIDKGVVKDIKIIENDYDKRVLALKGLNNE